MNIPKSTNLFHQQSQKGNTRIIILCEEYKKDITGSQCAQSFLDPLAALLFWSIERRHGHCLVCTRAGCCKGSNHKLSWQGIESCADSSSSVNAQMLSLAVGSAVAVLLPSIPQPSCERLPSFSSASLPSWISSSVSSPTNAPHPACYFYCMESVLQWNQIMVLGHKPSILKYHKSINKENWWVARMISSFC